MENEIKPRTGTQIFFEDGIGPTDKAREFIKSCGISRSAEADKFLETVLIPDMDEKAAREREDSSPDSTLSKIRRLAVNHRWAYQAQREEFLTPVIFDPLRNKYFNIRAEKATEGLNDGYRLKKLIVPGKYHGVEAVFVKNTHNDKVYSVRLVKQDGRDRGLASCTCPDFQRNKKFKVPCKHIWMVLLKGPEIGDPIRGWR